MVVVVMVRNESLLDFDSDVNDENLSARFLHAAGRGGTGAGDTALSGWSEGKNDSKKSYRVRTRERRGRGGSMVVITCMGCSLGSPRGGGEGWNGRDLHPISILARERKRDFERVLLISNDDESNRRGEHKSIQAEWKKNTVREGEETVVRGNRSTLAQVYNQP